MPVPLKEPVDGSLPEPSISLAGMSLDSLATYSVPSSSSVMLLRHRRRIPTGLHLLAGDELVHVVEAFVVAGVGDDGAVVGDVDVGALVLEPAQRGVLDRRRVGIPRVDLDDVAEPVDLVGRLGDVEARVEGLPLELARLQRDAVAVEPVRVHRVGRGRALGGAEVLLKFSSPESTVPHGVTPPAQLAKVPATVRPVGSAGVLTKSVPAAGPVSVNGVSAVMRRL